MFNRLIKINARVIFLCFILLIITGCWDQTELKDLAIISGEGIDVTDSGEIELSLEVILTASIGSPEQGALNMQKFSTLRSGTGKTFADAINDVERKFPRQLFPGHTSVFVFGEEAAKAGIGDHIDFIIRYPESRLRSYVFVSKGKTAKEALQLMPPIEGRSSEVLRKMAKYDYGAVVTIKELAQMLHSESGGDIILPVIERLPAGPGYDDLHTVAYINGAAIFKKDKMVKILDNETARGIRWIRNQIGDRSITVSIENEGYVSVWLYQISGVKLKPRIENDKWKITVEMEGKTEVAQNTTRLDMKNPEFLSLVSEAVVEHIENSISIALKEVQEVQSDVVGFADVFRNKYPKQWAEEKNNWDEKFSEIEVDYDIKINIARQGVSNPPVGIPEDEVVEE